MSFHKQPDITRSLDAVQRNRGNRSRNLPGVAQLHRSQVGCAVRTTKRRKVHTAHPTPIARNLNEEHRNLGNRNPEPRFRKLHRGYFLG